MTASELVHLPPPEWLLDNLVPQGGFVVLYGAPGIGKSFLALDWAASVATGISGTAVPKRTGLVIYVVAEGTGGFGIRVRAWQEHYHTECGNELRFITQPVLFAKRADVNELQAVIDETGNSPVLIIVDTAARCLAGSDENTSQDMGLFIDGIDELRRRYGCTVLLIHHSNKNDARIERGSSALRGAADAMILVTASRGQLVVECDKQKDAEQFEKIVLRHQPVCLEQPTAQSAVLVRSIDTAPAPACDLDDKSLAILGACPADKPLRRKDLLQGSKLPASTFDRRMDKLLEGGFMEQVDEGYVLTIAGMIAVGSPPPPFDPHETPTGVTPSDTATSTTPTPLRGGGWGAVVGATTRDHAPTDTVPAADAGTRYGATHSAISAGGRSGNCACETDPTPAPAEDPNSERASIDDLRSLVGGHG